MSKLTRWAIIAGSLAALVVPFAAAADGGSDGEEANGASSSRPTRRAIS